MHDGMPYGRNQGQGQGHSTEVDRQSPTGLIFEIFDFKNAVTLKIGLGVCQVHWKCHSVTAHTTSYWRSIVTRPVFNVEKVVTLKSGSEVT